MTTRPLTHLTLFLLIAFSVLALALGYWTLIAQESLLSREDNPRALIAYNRIQRGRIVDRHGQPLAQTLGQPGDYVRQVEPAAALVVGYASFRYGSSGIESAAESRLTGVEGQTEFSRWWHYTMLNEPQIGTEVRLTLDLTQQRAAYAALNHPGGAGAIVSLDIATGEILALASAPSFDPPRLDADFETFTADSNGPLINRATLGLYRADAVLDLFPAGLDLSQPPALSIPTRPAEGRRITPLQIALLAAAAANGGKLPAPRLIVGQESTGQPTAILSAAAAEELNARLSSGFTATVASGFGDETLGWFVGFDPDHNRAICVVLERSAGAQAVAVAQAVLR